MHDTVVKTRKMVREGAPQTGVAVIVSARLQEAGLARALADPLSAHFAAMYTEAYGWCGLADRLTHSQEDSPSQLLGEMIFSSRHLRVVLDDLPGFLDRAEDNLGELEETTHRESAYEREVAPFSRWESTRDFRDFLTGAGLEADRAAEGAQVEADLLKLVYTEKRLRDQPPKPVELYAMMIELALDSRRHLIPAFEDGSPFLTAIRQASETVEG